MPSSQYELPVRTMTFFGIVEIFDHDVLSVTTLWVAAQRGCPEPRTFGMASCVPTLRKPSDKPVNCVADFLLSVFHQKIHCSRISWLLFLASSLQRRRRVRVGRAHRNGRVFLQASLKLGDYLLDRVGNPAVRPCNVTLFLHVSEQVDDLRQRQGLGRVIHVLLPDEMRLPVTPLDGRKTVSHV